MYTVNMYYCYCILHHAPLHHSCHSPPIFPNFCHLSSVHFCLPSPFSCSISLRSCSAFPTPGPFFQFLPISPSSCTLSLYTVPSSLFQIWPAPLLPLLAPISQFLVLFSQFIFPIFQLFSLSPFICPICSTFIYFPVSSLICPRAHVLSFKQVTPPFLCSYLLCPLPILITSSSQFLPSISFSQFPSPSIQFQLVFC